MSATLYLLPNLLDEQQAAEDFLPANVGEIIKNIDALIAESEKGGRRFLAKFDLENRSIRDIPIYVLNEHTDEDEIDEIMSLIAKGGNWGLVSDCGLPCIADPGAQLILRAQLKKVQIMAIPGPSSIFMALMLSGLSGQSFAFNGYLPRKQEKIKPTLLQLQKHSSQTQQTQILIEAPYRSKKMFQYLISYLAPDTKLCVAWNLTMPNQGVQMKTIAQWKHSPLPDLTKTPAVFLFSAPKKAVKMKGKNEKRGFIYDPRKRKRRKFDFIG